MSMKFLFSVIKIYRLLNFIFAITDYGKHIKQLLNTRQWHPWVTITKLQASWGFCLGLCYQSMILLDHGLGDLFQRN